MTLDTTTWVKLNQTIMKATEDECREALEAEIIGQKRDQFAIRLFCRMNRLRTQRERSEMLKRLNNA